MADAIEKPEPACKFVYGRPEVVEQQLAQFAETYACTNLYFYTLGDHLEVCCTLIHLRELRRAQLMQGGIPAGVKMRPN